MKEVTVVIPNYNGMKYLPECMASLCQGQENAPEYEVLIIDNGSADGSVEYLDSEWCRKKEAPAEEGGKPQVRLIALPENTGFCHAVNLGIREARSSYVILLNNDTRVEAGFVKGLYDAIRKDEKIFSVSAKMLMWDKPELLDDAGDRYCVLGWAYSRGKGRPAVDYDKNVSIFSACGGAAIYRRQVFEEIGYFDEAHFAYLEDIDVGYRARIAGYDNIYCPAALVWHVGSGTSGSKYNSFKVKLAARNNVYLNYKNMPCLQLIINAIPIAAGIFVKYSFFRKLGFGKDYLEGLKEGIRTAKKCKKVAYRPERLKNYLAIELELLAGTFLYVYEFAVRQIEKKAASDKS